MHVHLKRQDNHYIVFIMSAEDYKSIHFEQLFKPYEGLPYLKIFLFVLPLG